MADYYRSGFEDDERRAPGATTIEAGRSEGRYASGYGYGPTYGGTAGGYGTTTGGYGGYGTTTGSFGGTTGAYGGTTGGFGGTTGGFGGTTGGFGGTTGGFGGTTGGYGGATGGYGGTTPESTSGTSRFGSTQFGRHEEAGFGSTIGTRHQVTGTGIGTWRSEQTGERRYPDYTRTQAWTSHQQTRYAEPGRAGIGQSVNRLQDFGAFGQGNPGPRRRFGNREYGPY